MIIHKNSIFDIDFSTFPNLKIIMFDIDDTLAKYNDPVPIDGTKEYMANLKEKGYRICLFSNNRNIRRIYEMASCLGVKYINDANKPNPRALKKIMKLQGLRKDEVVIVGNNYFTDGLCGKLSGVDTILVNPVSQTFPKIKNILSIGKPGPGVQKKIVFPKLK